jgi:hypothetical protein
MKKLTTHEAARRLCELGLHVRPRTLANWAWAGRGPAFHKSMTGRRLYDPATLEAFALQAFGPERRSTSDAPRARAAAAAE